MSTLRFEVVSGKMKQNSRVRKIITSLLNEDLDYWKHWDSLEKVLDCYDFLLATEEGKGIGYTALQKRENKLFTSRTFVIPSERRKGIATEMIKALGQWARKKGLKTIQRTGQNISMTGLAEKMRKYSKRNMPWKRIEIDDRFIDSAVTIHLKRKRPQLRRK